MFENLIAEIKAISDLPVVEVKVAKGGALLHGLSIGEGEVKATIYPDRFSGSDKERAVQIISLVEEHQPELAKVKNISEAFKDWNTAKGHLHICLRPDSMLDGAITRPYLDVQMYVRLVYNEFSCVVTEGLCDLWNISPAEVFDAAVIGTPVVRNFTSMCNDVGAHVPDEAALVGDTMLILSNEYYTAGASAILDTGFMERVAALYGGRMVVLPSSIHEVIALPDLGDYEGLRGMVRECNALLAPEDKLSDSVYLWANGKLDVVA